MRSFGKCPTGELEDDCVWVSVRVCACMSELYKSLYCGNTSQRTSQQSSCCCCCISAHVCRRPCVQHHGSHGHSWTVTWPVNVWHYTYVYACVYVEARWQILLLAGGRCQLAAAQRERKSDPHFLLFMGEPTETTSAMETGLSGVGRGRVEVGGLGGGRVGGCKLDIQKKKKRYKYVCRCNVCWRRLEGRTQNAGNSGLQIMEATYFRHTKKN